MANSMNFFNMLPGQRLILISAAPPPPPILPFQGRSMNRRSRTTRAVALLSAIVILLCWYIGRPAIAVIRNIWPPIRADIAPGETLAWLRIGSIFLLATIGITAVLLARGG